MQYYLKIIIQILIKIKKFKNIKIGVFIFLQACQGFSATVRLYNSQMTRLTADRPVRGVQLIAIVCAVTSIPKTATVSTQLVLTLLPLLYYLSVCCVL